MISTYTSKLKQLQIGDLIAKIPIIQGGMGVGISRSHLAGAVAKEGGVGIISTAQIGYDEEGFENDQAGCNLKAIKKHIRKAKELACGNGLVGVNISWVARFEDTIGAIFVRQVLLTSSGRLSTAKRNTNSGIRKIFRSLWPAGYLIRKIFRMRWISARMVCRLPVALSQPKNVMHRRHTRRRIFTPVRKILRLSKARSVCRDVHCAISLSTV